MILLVEEDAVTREAMAGALRSSSEVILEAANGEKALRLLANHWTAPLRLETYHRELREGRSAVFVVD